MATDLLGWKPEMNTNSPAAAKVRALLKLGSRPVAGRPFDFRGLPAAVPDVLFRDYFMPYAEMYWKYDAGPCNCQDLADALARTYLYVQKVRKESNLVGVMPLPECPVTAIDGARGFITKPRLRAVGGVARGNVMSLAAGALDGRCYFPNHWFCKFGAKYYDPTFGIVSADRRQTVDCVTERAFGQLRIKDTAPSRLYACDSTRPAPRFSNCWVELDADGWLSAEEWKSRTARDGLHTRSSELKALDGALKAFEDHGFPSLAGLKTAFRTWMDRNPKEATSRNKGGCVNGLAKFLAIPGVNYPVV